MKKQIAIIFGGKSAEHEVSVKSAYNIFNALDKNIFEVSLIGISKQGTWYLFNDASVFSDHKSLIDSALTANEQISLISQNEKPFIFSLKTHKKLPLDCAFPIIHGTMGEDGTLQGYFKILNLPFVGCGVLSSALGMDKDYMKRILSEARIANSKFVVLKKENHSGYDELVKQLGSPFFIKPANAGSSVGVHKIKSSDDFKTKLEDAFLYDHKVLAEEFIDGREIECSVLGLNHSARASLPGELIVKHEFYSYEAKYLDDNGAEIIIPARLNEKETALVQNLAVQTYKTLGCDGLARVDFFLQKNGNLLVNEINTLPGFTKISMYPKMWQATGLSYSDLISELIALAVEKHKLDSELKLSF